MPPWIAKVSLKVACREQSTSYTEKILELTMRNISFAQLVFLKGRRTSHTPSTPGEKSV